MVDLSMPGYVENYYTNSNTQPLQLQRTNHTNM